MLPAFFRLLPLLGALVYTSFAAEPTLRPDGNVSSRSFVDQAQIISHYQKELYAHQFGPSEVVFSKLRREYFVPTE